MFFIHTLQVSIRAVEDSRLLTWSAKDIQAYLKTNVYCGAVFSNLLGKDITHKLYQVQAKVSGDVTNAFKHRFWYDN